MDGAGPCQVAACHCRASVRVVAHRDLRRGVVADGGLKSKLPEWRVLSMSCDRRVMKVMQWSLRSSLLFEARSVHPSHE